MPVGRGNIGKSAIPVIAIQHIRLPEVDNMQINVSVLIVISPSRSERITRIRDTCYFSRIRERPITVIMV